MFVLPFSKKVTFNYQCRADCSTKSKNACHSDELPLCFNTAAIIEELTKGKRYVTEGKVLFGLVATR